MVTIEISSTGIRLMETSKEKVVRWAIHALEPGMFEHEVISDPEALGAIIKQLIASSGINKSNVVASISGLYSLSRIVTVPTSLEEPVTQEAVMQEVADVMPLSEEELYISWRIIGTGNGGKQVLVVGVPRDVLDSEVQALKAAGINLQMMDLKSMALARAVNKEQALIFNIEPNSFDVVIVVNGVPAVMRTTAWKESEIPFEERAEHLASALELTVNFYDSNNPSFRLDSTTPLFITGQLSSDLTLVERLQDRLGYSVEPLIPPLEYPAHLPVSQYAVNIGLALKGTATPKGEEGQNAHSLPDMNLLPQAYMPWRPSLRQIQVASVMAIAIILLFPLYQMTSNATGKTAELKAQYTVIQARMQQKQLEIKSREPLQKAIQEYKTIVDMGGHFAGDLEVIRNLADELGIKVDSIVHADNSINVACSADTYLAFRNYVTALQESGRFASPIPPPEGYPYIKAGTIKIEPNPD